MCNIIYIYIYILINSGFFRVRIGFGPDFGFRIGFQIGIHEIHIQKKSGLKIKSKSKSEKSGSIYPKFRI